MGEEGTGEPQLPHTVRGGASTPSPATLLKPYGRIGMKCDWPAMSGCSARQPLHVTRVGRAARATNVSLSVTHRQAVAYRLAANHISERLPAGSYIEAARFGLQDTAPRDALLGMHARVESCEPHAWAAPGLIQTYSPRAAVHVLPEEDFGIFTIGRLPLDPAARSEIERVARDVCSALNGREVRGGPQRTTRLACASGRLAVRWTTSALYLREVPRPATDFDEAHLQLCRRHIHAFGPTTPGAFAWWTGLSPRDATMIWARLGNELLPVDFRGEQAWILAKDEPLLRSPSPMRGARLLVAPDLRLLGQDRAGLFIGPGSKRHSPLNDAFHPNGVLVAGRIVGAWGRRGGRVNIKVHGRPTPQTRRAIATEAIAFPVPNVMVSITTAGQ